MKEHLFDKRVVQRALQEGLLDKQDYQRMLDELPDLSHKVQVVGVNDEPSERSEGEAAAEAPMPMPTGTGTGYAGMAPASVPPPAPAAPPAYGTHGAPAGFPGAPSEIGSREEGTGSVPPAAPAPGSAAPSQGASETLEMERPHIPGSYSPSDY